jgi:ankyrin repeat protein
MFSQDYIFNQDGGSKGVVSLSDKIMVLNDHTDAITDISVFPSGFLSCSKDKTIRGWNQNGKCILLLNQDSAGALGGHTDSINSICRLPNKQIATGSNDNTVRIWSLETKQCLLVIPHDYPVIKVCYLDNGLYASVTNNNDNYYFTKNNVRIWFGNTEQCIQKYEKFNSICNINSKLMAIAYSKQIDIRTKLAKEVQKILKHDAKILCMCKLNTNILSIDTDYIYIWDIDTGTSIKKIDNPYGDNAIYICGLDNKFLIGSNDGFIRIWNIESGTCIQEISKHNNKINNISILSDGRFVSGSDDKTIVLWPTNVFIPNELYNACNNNDEENVIRLIKQGHDINLPDEYMPLLILVTKNKNLTILRILINNGIDIDSKDKYGLTALHYASLINNLDIMNELLLFGASVDIKDSGGNTALIFASKNGYENIIKLLLNYGANVNASNNIGETVLINAFVYNSHKNSTNIFRLFLEHGADINGKTYNTNPLYSAIQSNNLDIVKELLNYGSDIDFIDKYIFSPLMWSIHTDRYDIGIELAKRDANVNIGQNVVGYKTAIEYARKKLPKPGQRVLENYNDLVTLVKLLEKIQRNQ